MKSNFFSLLGLLSNVYITWKWQVQLLKLRGALLLSFRFAFTYESLMNADMKDQLWSII